jgi:hypothetical protein
MISFCNGDAFVSSGLPCLDDDIVLLDAYLSRLSAIASINASLVSLTVTGVEVLFAISCLGGAGDATGSDINEESGGVFSFGII